MEVMAANSNDTIIMRVTMKNENDETTEGIRSTTAPYGTP